MGTDDSQVDNGDLLTLSELARRSHRSTSTLRKMMKDGRLKHTQRRSTGRREVLFDAAAIRDAGLVLDDERQGPDAGRIDEAVREVVSDSVSEALAPLGDRIDGVDARLEAVQATLAELLAATSEVEPAAEPPGFKALLGRLWEAARRCFAPPR